MNTMRQRFATVANELLETDPRFAVVLADIGAQHFSPSDRVINVGIREQTMIGVTAGMALAGFRPVAHSYTPFLIERPFEQIKLDFGHQELGAILVSIGASFDAAKEGRTHQAPGDVALISTLPGWTVHVPGHADEVESMLRSAAATDDKVYIRLSEEANDAAHPVTGAIQEIRTGSARGTTVITVGPMLDRTLAATEGLDATVLYASTIRPFDANGVRTAATSSDIVIVEPYLEGTSAGVVQDALLDRPTRILSIGVPNTEHRRYGMRQQHSAAHGLDAAGIRSRIQRFTSAAMV